MVILFQKISQSFKNCETLTRCSLALTLNLFFFSYTLSPKFPSLFKQTPPKCYNGEADLLPRGFVHQLGEALKSVEVNAYADEPTEDLTEAVSERIEKSRIAIVIFSSKYTESRWCLEELVKIKERMEQGKLEVIPIFYKLDTSAELEGGSGLNLLNSAMSGFKPDQLKIWTEALDSVSCMMGYHLYKNSDESKFITRIVKDVRRMLFIKIPMEEKLNESHDSLNEQLKDDSSKSECGR